MVRKSKNKSGKTIAQRDQYIIVLEDIRSQNQFLAEIITGMNDKLDGHSVHLKHIDKQLVELRVELADLQKDVAELRTDTNFIKGEVAIIRHNQISRDEFKLLEARVLRLERARAR